MQKKEVEAFKNELRNYNYYTSRVVTLEASIEFKYDRLGGVRGVDPSREPVHAQPNKEMEYKLRDDISKLEAEKERVERDLIHINEILNRMGNDDRWGVFKVYAERKRLEDICKVFNYSPSGYSAKLDRAIEEALNG